MVKAKSKRSAQVMYSSSGRMGYILGHRTSVWSCPRSAGAGDLRGKTNEEIRSKRGWLRLPGIGEYVPFLVPMFVEDEVCRRH